MGYNVVDESECSVLLAEQPSKRSLREWLFGTGLMRTNRFIMGVLDEERIATTIWREEEWPCLM